MTTVLLDVGDFVIAASIVFGAVYFGRAVNNLAKAIKEHA